MWERCMVEWTRDGFADVYNGRIVLIEVALNPSQTSPLAVERLCSNPAFSSTNHSVI